MSALQLVNIALLLPLLGAIGIALTGRIANLRETITLATSVILFGVILTLLGHILDGEKIVTPNHRSERTMVIGLDSDARSICRSNVIGVHKIKEVTVFDAIQQWALALLNDCFVPSHVWNFVFARYIKFYDLARNHAEPLISATFMADIEQHLQSQADPQKRLS